MKNYHLIFALFFCQMLMAQVGINTTLPNASLDIRSGNQAAPSNTDGILIPKIDVFPTTNPTAAQQGMLVYLTTATTFSGNPKPIGFYYWNQTPADWIAVRGTDGGTLDQAYDFGGAGAGKTITADSGAVLINGTDGLVSTGTVGSGAIAPSGSGTKMFWNPRKSAFRAGTVLGATLSPWDDTFVGNYSTAFGYQTLASGTASVAFGGGEATGAYSTAFGSGTQAMGSESTAFGNAVRAVGDFSTGFGQLTNANGSHSTSFGYSNSAKSYGEMALGIGVTDYTVSTNGATQFRLANATDRLFVIGNAIDANNNLSVDITERSDAIIILKNGLTRLPSTTNAMITAADGKAVVTKEYLQSNASGTLDQAYDFGGAGLGKTITADAGAVLIDGTDGLVSTGISGSGAVMPSGAGTRMVWNPRKAAFRVGTASATEWNDVNVGTNSIAMGFGTRALGSSSIALGSMSSASGLGSVAFGWSANANATQSTAFGLGTNANNIYATAFGYQTIASGRGSTSFGIGNETESFGEVVLGIGATSYTPSTNGGNQFRTANATDRLFVIGNAIDSDNDDAVDAAERSDAVIVLKNGLTRLPSTTNALITAADGKAVVTKEYLADNSWSLAGNAGTNAATNFIGTTDSQALTFRTDNTERISVLATGNVGIGTSTPIRNLQVATNSTSTTNGQLYLEQTGTGDALMHIGNTGGRHFNLGLDTSEDKFKIGTSTTAATAVTSTTLVTLLPTGEMGIGTINPDQKLHVSGPAGLTAVRIANTSLTGTTSNVALDFFRSSNINTDWRIYNVGANLNIGNSGDDLTTVNDLYQFQGARFMPINDATQSLGQLTNRWNTLFASNGTINTSDARQKKNINNLTYGLNDLMKLRPVSFEWKKDDGSGTKLGLIAQELQQVIPEVVRDWDWQEDEQGNRTKVAAPILGVFYSDLIPVLIKATQEQQQLIEKQQLEIEQLKQKMEWIVTEMEKLKK